MNEFDYIIREAREIFDFYGMNREKPVIDEILYNIDYALRHFLGDSQIFDENLKKQAPVLYMIQQVFNDVNQHYSWITARNQRGYDKKQLDSAKVSIYKMYFMSYLQNVPTQIPPRETRIRVKKLRSYALCLARGLKRQRLLGGNPMKKIYFFFLIYVLEC